MTAQLGLIDVDASLLLRLRVSDPEIVAELRRRPEGRERERYVQEALRLGVLALRMASGQVDAATLRQAGEQLVGEVRELLAARGAELQGLLGRYFDPKSGLLPQRLEALVKKDGELERLLGGDESLLARTLADHLGEDSPLFDLRDEIAKSTEAALLAQKEEVLRQFSLDRKDSALSRLVGEIAGKQGELRADVAAQVQAVVRELSLDHDGSALSRMSRKLFEGVEELARKNFDFQAEVRATLAAIGGRREEAERGARHGHVFEEAVGQVLAREAQRLGDVHEACGATTGAIKHCKVGDHLIVLGPESSAPDVRLVFEAKEDRSYELKQALADIEVARKNRGAQVGVFVFSRKAAPEGLETLRRYGNHVVVIWDAEDASSDVFLACAYSLARALAIREQCAADDTEAALRTIEATTRGVERHVQQADEIRRYAETVQSNGEKIVVRAARMRDELLKEVDELDRQVLALKTTAESGRK
jgi:hypothetical protein